MDSNLKFISINVQFFQVMSTPAFNSISSRHNTYLISCFKKASIKRKNRVIHTAVPSEFATVCKIFFIRNRLVFSACLTIKTIAQQIKKKELRAHLNEVNFSNLLV